MLRGADPDARHSYRRDAAFAARHRSLGHWGHERHVLSALHHHTILRALLRLVIWVVAILRAALRRGASVFQALFATILRWPTHVLGATFFHRYNAIAIVALIYGACNTAIDSKSLNRRDAEGKTLQASARMRTLLPMLRNTVFIIFAGYCRLRWWCCRKSALISRPLLAERRYLWCRDRLRLSQTLVKDFLTGLFIVVENTIAIGDVVQIGDHKGVVDAMSIRTLRLRDSDGAAFAHSGPFSEVTKIINMTRRLLPSPSSMSASLTTAISITS